ncbi:MAG: glycosyltransferase family 4 protein [Tepidisphaeraceae bacterium]
MKNRANSPSSRAGRPRVGTARRLRVVHLPVYAENAYQLMLMDALRRQGVEAIDGGGGGTFFRTALRRWSPDVLHFHWLHPYLLSTSPARSAARATGLLLQILVLKGLGTRLVWTVHNLANHDRRQQRVERFFTRLFAACCDRVIVHCPQAARSAGAAFGIRGAARRVEVIPHGNYIGHYPNDVTPGAARDRLGVRPGELAFVFLGRVQPYKGLLDLVDAFARLPEVGSRLFIAGRADAEQARALRERIERARAGGRVTFLPERVPDGDVQVYMKAADVVVLPFRDILSSGSLVLAMSFGRACVAPASGCVPETLDPAGGFLYDADDPHGLSRALRTCMDARGDLEAMGEHNRRRASRWTWDGIARRLIEIYRGTRANVVVVVSIVALVSD